MFNAFFQGSNFLGSQNVQHCAALVGELKIMSFVRPHVNVLQLLGACTKNLQKDKELFLIMELCENGSLKDYLQTNRFKFEGFTVNDVGQFIVSPFAICNSFIVFIFGSCCEYFKGAPNAVQTLLSYAYQAANGMEHLASEKVGAFSFC
jgi:hypothetical protein